MSIPNKQIGWSNESNLLWQIAKQLERLTGVTSKISGGGGGSATVVTKAEVDALIASSSLVPGSTYIITGVDVPLYGGTTIMLQAETTNKLTLAGHGIFYNPKYQNSQLTPNNGYGIWSNYITLTFSNIVGTFTNGNTVTANNGATATYLAEGFLSWISGNWSAATSIDNGAGATADVSGGVSPSYAIGQDVIWGGKHWTNTSGNVGTATDKYTLSSADWTAIAFNATDYNVEIDIIHYDYLHDMIIRRKDRWDNDVDGNFQWFDEVSNPNGYGYGNPIKDFQWGNGNDDWTTDEYWYLGVQSNYVKDSYLECINFIGEYLWYNKLTQQSYLYNNIIDVYSSVYNNTLNNNNSMYLNILTKSRIQHNNLIGYSSIRNNILYMGDIRNNLVNDSAIVGNKVSLGSTIMYNTIHLGLGITANTLSNSTINANTLTGTSYITENTLIGSCTINNNTLTIGSYITTNTITNNCNINSNTLTSTSRIYSNILNTSCTINSNTFTDSSYIGVNTLTTTCRIFGNIMDRGLIFTNQLTNSYIEYNTMPNGIIRFNTLTNATNIFLNAVFASFITNNTLDNSTIRYNTLQNSSFSFSTSGTITNKSISNIEARWASGTADISTATIIFTTSYPREMFRNSAGVTRLSYYDASDVLTVVNVNA